MSTRGFVTLARINPDKHREIASKGGKMAQKGGKAHKFTSEEAKIAAKISIANRQRNKE